MNLDPRKDADLLAELSALGGPNPGELGDDALIAGALAGLADPSRAPVLPDAVASFHEGDSTGRAPLVIAIAAAALAIAAAVILMVVRPAGLLGDASDESAGNLAQSVHEPGTSEQQATERQPAPAVATPRKAAARADVPEQTPEPTPEPALDPEPEPPPPDDAGDPVEPVAHRPKKAETPDAMLAHAQKLFGGGKTTQAVRAYEVLVSRHPSSAAAKAARVSLGRIELGRGNAKAALKYFDAYLAISAGSLVEEARYGRIRALRQLGRKSEEQRSIEAFLADYPKSIYAARLRKRASELDQP